MWVIAGKVDGTIKNDVWKSTNGSSWTKVVETADFSARYQHVNVVFNAKMWIAGGRHSADNSYKNDVWYSTDGITWTEAGAGTKFTKRGQFSFVVFNNKM